MAQRGLAQHVHDHGGGHDMDMSMPMFFQWGFDTVLWLRSWHPTSFLPFLGTWLVLFACAMGHEALAAYRVAFQAAVRAKAPSMSALSAQGYVAVPALGPSDKAGQQLRFRLTNSGLYAANIATAYLLMLAVMTYNGWLFLAVVLGMGLGHLLFFSRPHHLAATRVDTCCETAVGLG